MRTGDSSVNGRQLIDAEIASREIGVRGLTRIIARDAGEIERARRALYRLLEGKSVKEETAAWIEAGLGKPRGWLPRFDPRRQPAEVGESELEDLRGDLQSLGETVTRLATTLTLLVEAQRPALRARLLRALAGESL